MELKHCPRMENLSDTYLLIVPYGIETLTILDINLSVRNLLIVPYGIETNICVPLYRNQELLIVPYGIETRHLKEERVSPNTFNRTLWN